MCKKLNPAAMICVDPKCTNSAPCCFRPDCQDCDRDHQTCKMIRFTEILKRIQSKKQPINEEILKGIRAMEKIYDEAIDKLSKDKDYMVSQTEMMGYNEQEVEFITLLNDGLAGDLTGALNAKILSHTNENVKWEAEAEFIERYWDRKKAKFNEMFAKLKSICYVGKPTLESKITEDLEKILDFFEESQTIIGFKLLYRASENGYQVATFHAKCDNIPNTLVIARTEFGNIIGGFTQLPWNMSHAYGNDTERKTFLYSLTNN